MGLLQCVHAGGKRGDAKGTEGILLSFHWSLRIEVKLKEDEKKRLAGCQEIGLIHKTSSKELPSNFISRRELFNLFGLHNHLSAGEPSPCLSFCLQA